MTADVRLRPYAGESDIAAIVAIMNAEWAHDGVPERVTEGEKRAEYGHASAMFDAARDVTLAEVDGEPVAYAIRGWVDVADSELREYRTDGAVLPQWRGRGIGRAVLRESMRRAMELAATHDTPRGRVMGSFSHQGQPADEALLRSEGYVAVRYGFDMGRPNLDDVPEVALPEGLEVREVTRADAPAVFAADIEAFRDHWGGFDDSPAELQRWLDSPEFDPTLWVVAFDAASGEVAGAVINAVYAEENAELGLNRGWLDSVFTRRPWRRRGLARALIARSLVKLRERGLSSAVLGVDAENPSGALGLYESVGFVVEHRSTAWRKPFEVP
ncbi:MAG TPA: GNAT family N-acetyltransferase, partial [Candidatus Limnocylindrales bacterium]